jgi:hypothetical protein
MSWFSHSGYPSPWPCAIPYGSISSGSPPVAVETLSIPRALAAVHRSIAIVGRVPQVWNVCITAEWARTAVANRFQCSISPVSRMPW